MRLRHALTAGVAAALAAFLQLTVSGGKKLMLIALAVILAVAWLLGFSVFHVASAALHILIVLAVVALIAHFFTGRGVGRGTLAPR
jgi:hypothetical protein